MKIRKVKTYIIYSENLNSKHIHTYIVKIEKVNKYMYMYMHTCI